MWSTVTRRSIGLLMLIYGLSAVGCLGGSPTGTVAGKVSYQGKPVPAGCLVTFISNEGFAALGTVDDQGSYRLVMAGEQQVPVANYNVSVTFPGLQGPTMTEDEERLYMAGDPEMLKKFKPQMRKAPFPDKYSDPILRGLSFAIKEGVNTFDIQLQ